MWLLSLNTASHLRLNNSGAFLLCTELGKSLRDFLKDDGNMQKYVRIQISYLRLSTQGFPGGTVVKNPPANAEDTGSSPGPGRSYMPQSN